MDDWTRHVGALLRKIRTMRGLTLEEVAGRAGINAGFLSHVERGEKPLERLSHWRGVAFALEVPLPQLLQLDLPAPGNGGTDTATEHVRDALHAATAGYPGGEVLPVDRLRGRVIRAHRFSQLCRTADLGLALPGLIRDLHTTLHTTLRTGHDLDPVRAFLRAEALSPVALIRDLRCREVLREL